MNNNIKDVVDKWEICAKRLKTATQAHEFTSFKSLYKEGHSYFKFIKKIIDNKQKDLLEESRHKLNDIILLWQDIINEIYPWMDVLQMEIKEQYNIKKKKKKINNGYKYLKKTGNKVRIKAK